jgi:hypothetical protein
MSWESEIERKLQTEELDFFLIREFLMFQLQVFAKVSIHFFTKSFSESSTI